MKALSLYQPWASAVVLGIKQYETRPRRMNHRGLLAIHAAKKRTAENLELFDQLLDQSEIYWAFEDALELDYDCLPYGALIGTVEVRDCQPTGFEISEHERLLGNFDPGRYAIALANPIRFREPIPARGYQSLWNLTPELADKVGLAREAHAFPASIFAGAKLL